MHDHVHADRTANINVRALPVKSIVFDRAANGLRNLQRPIIVAAFEQYAKFIPTKARQRVGGTDFGLHDVRDLAQQLITCNMAEGIVDHFELVQVDVEKRMRICWMLLRIFQRGHQAIFKFLAIDQTGQRVV